jgi:hypothetical protein
VRGRVGIHGTNCFYKSIVLKSFSREWAVFKGFYFFRSRLAFTVTRLYQGARREANDDLPPLEINFMPVSIAASAFSRTMRRYSAGEHLFFAIKSVRRVIVSQDAIVRFVINTGRDIFLRRFRAFMTASLIIRIA